MDKPLVAVFMITYNHEKYISLAIESVLMQKTTFPIELIIGEDCSTDNTGKICSKYLNENPEHIELFLNQENLGIIINARQIYEACFSSKAKYISFLEGDDYWTDPFKLQKQVDFLENHSDYGIVCTDIEAVNERGLIIDWPVLTEVRKRYKSGYVFYDQFKGATINTLTACFRASLIEEVFSNDDKWYILDLWLWLRISMKSKVKYFDYVSAHYRRHNNNYTSPERVNEMSFMKQISYVVWDNLIYYFKNRRKLPVEQIPTELLKHSLRLFLKSKISFLDKLQLLPIMLRYSMYFPELIMEYWKKSR